jgi:hypothetical protein
MPRINPLNPPPPPANLTEAAAALQDALRAAPALTGDLAKIVIDDIQVEYLPNEDVGDYGWHHAVEVPLDIRGEVELEDRAEAAIDRFMREHLPEHADVEVSATGLRAPEYSGD